MTKKKNINPFTITGTLSRKTQVKISHLKKSAQLKNKKKQRGKPFKKRKGNIVWLNMLECKTRNKMANFNTINCKKSIGANANKYCILRRKICFGTRCTGYIKTEPQVSKNK